MPISRNENSAHSGELVRSVRVESPGRLHLGFFDLNGNLGRKFGSLGLALEGLSTVVIAEKSENFDIRGEDAARAKKYAARTLSALNLPERISIRVEQGISAHAGLGSGTQLALTVAAAINSLFGLAHDVRELARFTGRGQRSGIGVGVFENGGFVIDGGLAENTTVPPLLTRFEFPPGWHVVLIQDDGLRGLSGRDETLAFAALAPMSEASADALCRLTLMGVFPAIVERDFDAFARHLTAIQARIGEHFGPRQGGQFSSPAVAKVMEWIKASGASAGIGQTSWGPTAFAFVESEARGEHLLTTLTERFTGQSGLRFSLHRGRNYGADIQRT